MHQSALNLEYSCVCGVCRTLTASHCAVTSGGAPCPAAGVRLEADNRVKAAQKMKMSERKPETTIVAESPKDVINS